MVAMQKGGLMVKQKGGKAAKAAPYQASNMMGGSAGSMYGASNQLGGGGPLSSVLGIFGLGHELDASSELEGGSFKSFMNSAGSIVKTVAPLAPLLALL
jgi:hypothetical protein